MWDFFPIFAPLSGLLPSGQPVAEDPCRDLQRVGELVLSVPERQL